MLRSKSERHGNPQVDDVVLEKRARLGLVVQRVRVVHVLLLPLALHSAWIWNPRVGEKDGADRPLSRGLVGRYLIRGLFTKSDRSPSTVSGSSLEYLRVRRRGGERLTVLGGSSGIRAAPTPSSTRCPSVFHFDTYHLKGDWREERRPTDRDTSCRPRVPAVIGAAAVPRI